MVVAGFHFPYPSLLGFSQANLGLLELLNWIPLLSRDLLSREVDHRISVFILHENVVAGGRFERPISGYLRGSGLIQIHF